MMSSEAIVQNYLNDARAAMRAYKKLADKALAVKAAMFNAMGIEVHLCGHVLGAK